MSDHPDPMQYEDSKPHQDPERYDRKRDLDPQAEVPERRFDAVAPRVGYKVTSTIDDCRRRPLPPGEYLRKI